MHEPQDQIATLEAEIESLSERAERCRKTIILAKLGTLAGGLVLLALVLGLVRSSPVLLVASLTAVVSGIALAGPARAPSTRSGRASQSGSGCGRRSSTSWGYKQSLPME